MTGNFSVAAKKRNLCAAFCAVMLAAACLGAPGASGSEIILARGGMTEYVIAHGGSPEPAEITAAEKLSELLEKVTGAEFRIIGEGDVAPGGAAVYVGWTEHALREGINYRELGPEEWLVKTAGNNLIITGGRPAGTINGVFEFLETAAGVHFLCPKTAVIPEAKELAVAPGIMRGEPAFVKGLVSWGSNVGFGMFDIYGHRGLWEKVAFFHAFNKNSSEGWNHPEYGMIPKRGGPFSHTMGRYMHPDEYGETNPEYFAMHRKADGTLFRNIDSRGHQTAWFDHCLSNRDVRDIFTEKLRSHLEGRGDGPFPVYYNISQNDCLPWHCCLCPDCRKIVEREGAESGLLIDFINEIADNVREEYPGAVIRTTAYNHTLAPPRHIRPAENVEVQWVYSYGRRDFFHPLTHGHNRELRGEFEGWAELGARMGAYDYYRRYVARAAPGFYVPWSNISAIIADMRYFHENNTRSIYISNGDIRVRSRGNPHIFHQLKTWLGLKLMQDPYRDADNLLDIFFEGYYGPGGGYMRAFLDYLETRQEDWDRPVTQGSVRQEEWHRGHLDLDFFVTADGLLDKALEACAGDGYYSARVKRERLVVDSALLHMEPNLRRESGEGGLYPFDRERILARHRGDWEAVLSKFYSEPQEHYESLSAHVGENLDFLRGMPMYTAESIRRHIGFVDDGDIMVDGRLDEAAWEKAVPVNLTVSFIDGGGEPEARTEARALWSDKKLYLGFKCYEGRMEEMRYDSGGYGEDNRRLWQDASVEVFLNPSGDRENYYQLIINPAGLTAEASIRMLEGERDFDWSWSSGGEYAVVSKEDSWKVEMAVPFESIGFEPGMGRLLVCNFGRSRRITGDESAFESTTWSPFVRGFHDVPEFGALILGEAGARLLTAFDSAAEMPAVTLWRTAEISFSSGRASVGAASLRVDFPVSERGQGAMLTFPGDRDWRGYGALAADIYLEKDDSVLMTTRITTGDGRRFFQQNRIQPGWNKRALMYDFSRGGDISGELDEAEEVLYYAGRTDEPFVVYIDNIRLVEGK